MSGENGQPETPIELFREIPAVEEPSFPPPLQVEVWTPQRRSRRSLILAVALFLVTVVSALAAGTEFASAYAAGHAPTFDDFFSDYLRPLVQPKLLLSGVPFAFTLLGILLAHELGHFFACRYYGIEATYPYFVPAPTLIGTVGAFIRIRSPIVNRRALFDMALAGPLVGFVIAVPALALAVARSKVIVAAQAAPILFGRPLIERLLEAALRPGVSPPNLLLSPAGRAAWVGLFATALNLLPSGQLDGGHILYALSSERHRRLSFLVAVALIPLAFFYWEGWLLWAVLLVVIGFRHPPLVDRWQPLDPARRLWAAVALGMFVLCFMPAPFAV